MADKEKYGLEPTFEAGVARLCCTDRRFWARVGKDVDPERLQQAAAALLVGACRAVAKDLNAGPGAAKVVAQRLYRFMADGRVRKDVVDAAVAMLYDPDAEDPQPDAVAAELVPVVRRKMQKEAVETALHEFSNRGDFSSVVRQIDRAARLGEVSVVETMELGVTGFTEFDKRADLLPTGIMELDAAIGGMGRGSLGVVIAMEGTGKSLYMMSQAAKALHLGMHVGFATLEMKREEQFARLVSNLTGVPTHGVVHDKDQRQRAMVKLQAMLPALGTFGIADFGPYETTVSDLVEWVKEREERVGRKMDLLVVDSADKCIAPQVQRADNEYLAMRYVYGGLRRDVAAAREMWVWTGSQASRRGKRDQGPIDLDNVADSKHKTREADLVITLNRSGDADGGDDSGMVEIFVAKNRSGRARMTIGPLMGDPDRGRIVCL